MSCFFWLTVYNHFNHFSRTTWLSGYQKGKTNLDFTGARDSEWQWHQLGHMQVRTSLQTDNHASTPPLSHYCYNSCKIMLLVQASSWCWRCCRRVSSERLGDVRLYSSVIDLPVGAVTWSTPLSPVRVQVSPWAGRLRTRWWRWCEFTCMCCLQSDFLPCFIV